MAAVEIREVESALLSESVFPSKEPVPTLEQMKGEGMRVVPTIQQAPPPTVAERIEDVTGTIPGPIKGMLAPGALVTAAQFIPGIGPAIRTGKLAGLLTEMGLSALGEVINQQAGLTEKSTSGIVESAASPFGGRIIGGTVIRGGKAIARAIVKPTSLAIITTATEEALKYPSVLRASLLPGQTSKELFAEVRKMGAADVHITLNETLDASKGLEDWLGSGLKSLRTATPGINRAYNLARNLVKELRPQRDPATGQMLGGIKKLDFEVLEGELSKVNSIIIEMDEAGNAVGKAAALKLKSALFRDIDNAVDSLAGPLKAKYLEAAKAFRMEKAIDTIEDFIEVGSREEQSFGAIRFIRGATLTTRMRELIRTDKLFAESFSLPERRAIMDTFAEWAKLPRTGMETGDIVITGAFGGGAARFLFPGSGAEGAAIGAIGAIAGNRILAHAVTSEKGRRLLLALAKDDKSLIKEIAGNVPGVGAILGSTLRHPQGFLDRPRLAILASALGGGKRAIQKGEEGPALNPFRDLTRDRPD